MRGLDAEGGRFEALSVLPRWDHKHGRLLERLHRQRRDASDIFDFCYSGRRDACHRSCVSESRRPGGSSAQAIRSSDQSIGVTNRSGSAPAFVVIDLVSEGSE